MPKEPVGALAMRRVRKGTRSCQECRQRKVKCEWASDNADICNNCAARSRNCVAQGPTSPTLETAPPTSRERIRHLEAEVNSLWSVVRRLEANNAHGNSDGTVDRTREPYYVSRPSETRPQSAGPSSGGLRELQDRGNNTNNIARDSLDSNQSDVDDGFNLSPANQPIHLRQLFDNDIINSKGSENGTWETRDYTGSQSSSFKYLDIARRELQKLLPSRHDVSAIANFTFPWMTIYTALFPRIRLMVTAEEMLANYDELCTPNANPMSLANLLISLALSVRQIPEASVRYVAPGIRSVTKFVDDVSEAVDRTIASNDTLAATVDGIETALLFIRLAMACVDVRKMWIRLRRIIALAELIGLPRASKSLTATSSQQQKSAADLWNSICVVDRLAGMMFNLPSATKAYPTMHMDVISANGNVNVQAYTGRLTEIALSVQELDGSATSERPGSEQLTKVFAVDERLRTLTESTPPAWWVHSVDYMTPERLVQYWHHYFTVRTHLRLALADDETGRFRLSYNTCLSASQNMARRYMELRPLLPAGFFACKITDFQMLTAAVFLVFDANKPGPPQSNSSSAIVEQLTEALTTASERSGGEFAKKAAIALRSLQALMQSPTNDGSQEEMTLNLPMLGKLAVTRRKQQVQAPEQIHATQTITGWDSASGADTQMLDQTVPFWSMDVLDEDFSFLPEAMSGQQYGFPEYGFSLGVAPFQ